MKHLYLMALLPFLLLSCSSDETKENLWFNSISDELAGTWKVDSVLDYVNNYSVRTMCYPKGDFSITIKTDGTFSASGNYETYIKGGKADGNLNMSEFLDWKKWEQTGGREIYMYYDEGVGGGCNYRVWLADKNQGQEADLILGWFNSGTRFYFSKQ